MSRSHLTGTPCRARNAGRAWVLVGVLALGIGALAVPVSAAEDPAHKQLTYGVKMARRGLWSEALFRFRQAAKLQPNDPHILNNLAVSMEAVGLFDEALEVYQRGLKAAPGDPDLRQNYARFVEFYQSFKGPEEAVTATEDGASRLQDASASLNEAAQETIPETIADSEAEQPAMIGEEDPQEDGGDGSRP